MHARIGGRIYRKSGKFWYYKDRTIYRKAGFLRSLFLDMKMKSEALKWARNLSL